MLCKVVPTDTIRVLMIEDNPADAAAIKGELRNIDSAVIEFEHTTTLAEGLRRLEADGFDVLLLDLGLPDSKGQETIRRVIRSAPEAPIVILTVSDDEAMVVGAINQGIQEYFVKGTSDERLLAKAIRYAIYRKRAERALRDSESQLRGTFENEAIGIAHIDADGRLLRANQKLCDLMGHSREELLKHTLQEMTFPPDLAEDLVLFKQLMGGEQTVQTSEKRCVRADGSFIWVRVTRSVQRDIKPAYCISFVEDITDRKKAETSLVQIAAELARSNQDLAQFANVTSHDLQEPLRMVESFLKILNERYGPQLDDKAREYIGFAADGAERMSQLIRDMLAYSRVGRGGKGFVQTDMEAVLARALGNLRASIKEARASISHDPLPTVTVASSLMLQLLQNLVGNAIKYRTKETKPQIHVGAKREDNGWCFWVRDNGIGIKAEDQERIFLIFQRLHTRNKYPGTGIGLAICKRIVEHHDGRMWVESEPGKGSSFYFTIPDRT